MDLWPGQLVLPAPGLVSMKTATSVFVSPTGALPARQAIAMLNKDSASK
jgi:hypothetical protein